MRPIDITGNPEYQIDPGRDDFYQRLIELRLKLKGQRAEARRTGDTALATRLEAEQEALKICANAATYGIFMEYVVEDRAEPVEVSCHGANGSRFTRFTDKTERPGAYLHPLLGTLITGAARLMLALVERLATEAGITWAFCDTDSMALAKPDGMGEEPFLVRCQKVIDWFAALNPYRCDAGVLRLRLRTTA